MKNDVQVVVRLPSSLVAKIDELAQELSRRGLPITRTATLRMLVVRGLDAERSERAPKNVDDLV